MPKASARRFHPSNRSRPNGAPLALRKCSRVLRHRRAPADCFGANPVASALGDPARRDPGEAMRTYHEGPQSALNTGTFYFGGNRNFLLWSDTRPSSAAIVKLAPAHLLSLDGWPRARLAVEEVPARVAKLVDAKDLKSFSRQRECGFDSRPGHQKPFTYWSSNAGCLPEFALHEEHRFLKCVQRRIEQHLALG